MSDKSPLLQGSCQTNPPNPPNPPVYGTSAHPAQNIKSSDIDLDAKMRELNDMDRPIRHAPQILFIFLAYYKVI